MRVDRRRFLRGGLAAAAGYGLASAVAPFERLAAAAAPSTLPAIQHDVGAFIGQVVFLGPDGEALPERQGGIGFRFGPVHTAFFSIRLKSGVKLRRSDQREWASALATIESAYPFSPSGLFTSVAYGLPYFRRLPAQLVAQHLPRLLDSGRPAFEEAVASPTDIAPAKGQAFPEKRFQVPVRITDFDMLLTMRSDSLANLLDVTAWLTGSGRLRGRAVRSPRVASLVASAEPRLMVAQRGFPRRFATQRRLPFASLIPEHSPMWMGFADQQRDAGGPAEITTFAGDDELRLTTASPADYFGRASVQHASQVTLDLRSWYLEEPYEERVGYMFRQVPTVAEPRPGDPERGPAFLRNEFRGPGDAEENAKATQAEEGHGEMGHTTALHRSSRTPAGTPLHIRLDGPGFDALDLPRGTGPQPKLQFSVFVPTSEQFTRMRRHGSSTDLAARYAIPLRSNGLEAFTTTTRRQNFLVPPREHRAFPLAELVP